MLRRTRDSTIVSFGGCLMAVLLTVGAFAVVLFAALIWWFSDVAYDIHWIIGFPIRLFALVVTFGAFMAVLTTAFQLFLLILAIGTMLVRIAFGRSIE
jgi:hypothetical protein